MTTKAKRKTRRPPAAADPAPANGEGRVIALADIVPSPFQIRRQFEKAEIDALAASIRTHGLLQAPVVREKAGYRSRHKPRYDLVCGERRVRAARAAGLKEIRVDVRRLSDAECRELILVENLDREDLSAIEEAEGFRQMIGDAPGPTELARRLGLSQGHVSNRLRLLELPADWQQRIISHEIPATHARELLAYVKHPKILQAIARKMGKRGFQGSVAEFRDKIREGAINVTKAMRGGAYYAKSNVYVPIFTPTKEQDEELGLVKVPCRGSGWELRATNTKRYDELQRAHAKKCLARHKGARAGKSSGKSTDGKPRKPTPAQRAKLEKERTEQFQRKLWSWYVDWLRYLIAERIRQDATYDELLVILLGLAGEWPDKVYLRDRTFRFHRHEWLEESARAQKVSLGTHVVKTLAGLLDGQGTGELFKVAMEAAARCFYADGPIPLVPDADVETIAKLLRVDVQSAWLDAQAGPLSEAFWNLHNREQLLELGKELLEKVDLPAGGKKGDLVTAFLARKPKPEDKEVGINLPKELKRIKRPK